MLILSKINNYIMSMLKSIRDWLLNLVPMFLCSLTDHRWVMFYLTILLLMLSNIYKIDGKNVSVNNTDRNDGDGREDDDGGEGSDEGDEDTDDDDDDDGTNKRCRRK